MKETDATKEHANLKFNFDQAISKPQKQAREPQKTIANSGLKANSSPNTNKLSTINSKIEQQGNSATKTN